MREGMDLMEDTTPMWVLAIVAAVVLLVWVLLVVRAVRSAPVWEADLSRLDRMDGLTDTRAAEVDEYVRAGWEADRG